MMLLRLFFTVAPLSISIPAHLAGTEINRTFWGKLGCMNTDSTRFDTRLSKQQKAFLEYAAQLGGYRTLTEFVISSAQNKAEEIVQKHQAILASKKDQKTFFDAILNPPAPGKRLSSAVKKYHKMVK